MSGLPDEAVEAMTRAMLDMPRGFQISDSTYRRWAQVSLAALPAGVYVSDGKGKVEAPSAGRERATMDHLARGMRLSAKEKAIAEDFTRSYLAALSATDTEKGGE